MKKDVNFGELQNECEKKQIDGNIVKLEFLPTTPEKSQCLNGCTDDMRAKVPEPDKSIFQCRYLVVLLDFFVFCEINAYALGTSIGVVAMVNNTAVNSQSNSNVTVTSCPINTTDSDGHSFHEKDGEFNWSPAIQGYVLGAGFLGYVVTQMPGGLLAQTYGAKTTLICGLFLSSVAHVLSPFAAWTSSYLLMVVQFLRGFGQGFLPSAHCVLSANWFPTPERGLLNSLVLSGYSIGSLLTGFSAGALCSSSFLGGWPSVFFIHGGLGLILCLCFQLFLYESPKCHPRIKDAELNYILKNQEMDLSESRPPIPWKKIFTSGPVYAMVYAVFATYWIGAHFLSVQPIFLGTILRFSIQENGIFTSLPFIFQSIFVYSAGGVSSWLNKHNYVGVDKVRKGCNFLCCLGYSLGLLGVYFSGCDRWTSAFLSVAAMSFNGFSSTGCMITPVDMSPTFAGTLMGLANTVACVAAFSFPVLVGIMTNEEQTLEQWNKIFMLCIALIMSSGIIFCLFGSADVQSWNYPENEEVDKNRSKECKMEEYVGTAEKPVNAVADL